MPELPEVETIRLDLAAALVQDKVVSFEVFDERLMSRHESQRVAKAVVGKVWTGLGRKGKYLWAELSDGSRLMFHLRMTGQLLVHASLPAKSKARLMMRFASGRALGFYDQRRFGEVWLLAEGQTWRSSNPLGPDALTELKRDDFVKLAKARTTRIQPLLMDQAALAGVGNIYAQEALFKAAIRPTRHANRMTAVEAGRLYYALQETLEAAIVHHGSSNRDYLDARGERGSAQTLHAVYRKGGRPCVRCHGPLRTIRVGGRGSVFCPKCQR